MDTTTATLAQAAHSSLSPEGLKAWGDALVYVIIGLTGAIGGLATALYLAATKLSAAKSALQGTVRAVVADPHANDTAIIEAAKTGLTEKAQAQVDTAANVAKNPPTPTP
jgi:hypothetical protein